MKKIIVILSIIALQGCDTDKDRAQYVNEHTINIKILELKQVGYPSHNYYIIDTNRNSYEIYPNDYVRLKEDDSLKIYTGNIFTEIIEIYTK